MSPQLGPNMRCSVLADCVRIRLILHALAPVVCATLNIFSITPNVAPAHWQRQLQHPRTVIPTQNLSKWLLTGCVQRVMRFTIRWVALAIELILSLIHISEPTRQAE